MSSAEEKIMRTYILEVEKETNSAVLKEIADNFEKSLNNLPATIVTDKNVKVWTCEGSLLEDYIPLVKPGSRVGKTFSRDEVSNMKPLLDSFIRKSDKFIIIVIPTDYYKVEWLQKP